MTEADLIIGAFAPFVMFFVGSFVAAQDSNKHAEQMYELGKRHGRELAAMETYKLSLELFGVELGDDEE